MRKVAAGDPIDFRARDWNQLCDLVNRRPGSSVAPPPRSWGYTWVWVRNDSSTDWPRAYAAVVQGVVGSGAEAGDPIFAASSPSVGSGSVTDGIGVASQGSPAVTLEPIKIGATGRAVISGPCRVVVRDLAYVNDAAPFLGDFSRKETTGDSGAVAGQVSPSFAGRFTLFPRSPETVTDAETWAVLHGLSAPPLRAVLSTSFLFHDALNPCSILGNSSALLWCGDLISGKIGMGDGVAWAVGRLGRLTADATGFAAPPLPTNPASDGKVLKTYGTAFGVSYLDWLPDAT